MTDLQLEDVTAALQAASVHLNEGRAAEAIALSDTILKQFGNNADAFHISGLGRYRLGQIAQALPLLISAQKNRRSDGHIANSLAQAHLALGQIDEASVALERLAKKKKLPAPGLNTLGDCRLRQGKLTQARTCFEQALKLQPDLTPALVNLGEVLRTSGDISGAIQHYQNLLKSYPTAMSAWRNLGLALQEAEQFSESIAPLEKYLEAAPHDINSQLSLGASLFKMGKPAEALRVFDKALSLSPEHAEGLNNRGLALRGLNRTEEAESAFKKALELDPTIHAARTNLGNLLHQVRGAEAALSVMDDAIALNPTDPMTHMEHGHILMQEGKIADGWDGYNWRFRLPPEFAGKRDFPFDTWKGEDLAGKTLLVWGEQGIGDEIIYASMINEISAKAAHVILECAPRLQPVFQRSFPGVEVVARTTPVGKHILGRGSDYQISMGGLCQFLRPNLATFQGGNAYLTAEAAQKTRFRERYANTTTGQTVVGIAWHSGRAKDGWLKTIPLDQWRPILSQPNVTFVSLQYGDHTSEIEAVRTETGCNLIVDSDVDPLEDMDTFVAQVAAMDLVIANSNAAAHVAGALGIPVWTMVPHLGSGGLLWYWFKEGAKSPWYDSMTLYRQTKWRHWTDVINGVTKDLAQFLGSK